MTAPSNNVFQNGLGQVTGDSLNTLIQWTTNVATLRTFIGTATMIVQILGTSTINDGGQGVFYWNASGTGPDDNGTTNVVPTGATVGCWTRIQASSSSVLASIANNTGLVNISGGLAAPIANTLTAWIDSAIGNTQGQILYRGASTWSALNPGSAGQFLQSGGAAANPSWIGGASGAIVLLSTVNASGASTVTFNSTYLTSTYNKYIIEFDGAFGSVGADMYITGSTNNGVSYLNSGYKWTIATVDWTNPTDAPTGASSNSDTKINVTGGDTYGATSTTASYGTIKISNPSASAPCSLIWDMVNNQTNSQKRGAGYIPGNTAINNIKIANSSGNITGNFHLYGISGT